MNDDFVEPTLSPYLIECSAKQNKIFFPLTLYIHKNVAELITLSIS